MSTPAPLLQGFFTDRRIRQRQASPHTIIGYRDTWRLLVTFAAARAGTTPSQLSLADLDATTIGAFLDYLATVRRNAASTRNGRLAAIHSLSGYAAPRAPEDAAVIQRVLAIPHRRADRPLVAYLTTPEIDALLTAPDRSTWAGQQQGVIPPAGLGGPVGRGEQGVGLGCGEVGDQGPVGSPVRDGEHPLDDGGVFWRARCHVAGQRVDGGQPAVAGAGGVAADGRQVVQERADRRGVEVGQRQLRRRRAGSCRGEGHQQPPGVPVAGDGGGAGLPLADEPVGVIPNSE